MSRYPYSRMMPRRAASSSLPRYGLLRILRGGTGCTFGESLLARRGLERGNLLVRLSGARYHTAGLDSHVE
eukprot:1124705-Amorphochlora_amoeboformis.AAC.1